MATLPPGRYYLQGRWVVVEQPSYRPVMVQSMPAAPSAVVTSASHPSSGAVGQVTVDRPSDSLLPKAEAGRQAEPGPEKVVAERPATPSAIVD